MDVPQQDRNLGMLAHGLVAAVGLGSLVPGLSWLGLPAVIAAIVLYFVYKGKSEFVTRHFKQAAGLGVVLFLLGLVIGLIFGGLLTTAVLSGGFGAAMAVGSLTFIVSFAIGIIALIFGILGLLRAQKGEAYLYPIVGAMIDRIGI